MNKKDRQTVFDKYNGRCAYCGENLPVKGWHVDHIEPIVRDSKWDKDKGRYEAAGTCRKPENDGIDNYNPSCASCNINKHSMSLEDFRMSIKKYVQSLNLYSTQYKIAKRYRLIKETEVEEVVFYFETYQGIGDYLDNVSKKRSKELREESPNIANIVDKMPEEDKARLGTVIYNFERNLLFGDRDI